MTERISKVLAIGPNTDYVFGKHIDEMELWRLDENASESTAPKVDVYRRPKVVNTVEVNSLPSIEINHRLWYEKLTLQLGMQLARVLADSQPDAVLVRSSEPADVWAALLANHFLSDAGMQIVPVFLEVDRQVQEFLDRENSLNGIQSSISHGYPLMPSNVSLSLSTWTALMDLNLGEVTGRDAVEYLRSLSELRYEGLSSVFAHSLVFVSGIMFVSKHFEFMFTSQIGRHEGRDIVVLEDKDVRSASVSSAEIAFMESVAKYAGGEKPFTPDINLLRMSLYNLKIARLSPVHAAERFRRLAARNKALNDPITQNVKTIVYKDLVGLPIVDEMKTLKRQIEERSKPERFR